MVSIPFKFVPCTLPTPSLGKRAAPVSRLPRPPGAALGSIVAAAALLWPPVLLEAAHVQRALGAGAIPVFPVCGAAGPALCLGRCRGPLWPHGRAPAESGTGLSFPL